MKAQNLEWSALLDKRAFFASWSGGKDSCLAFLRAVRAGGDPRCLLNILTEDGTRSRSHGLPVDVLKEQAASLGVPIIFRSASWDDYEASFLDAASELASGGVDRGVFGDIDIEPHREWVERVCESAGVVPIEPLWKGGRGALIEEFLEAGFVARVIVVRENALEAGFLGRTFDKPLVEEFEARGVDPSGENGEYHTVVVNGPTFKWPLNLSLGSPMSRNGYSFMNCSLGGRQIRR